MTLENLSILNQAGRLDIEFDPEVVAHISAAAKIITKQFIGTRRVVLHPVGGSSANINYSKTIAPFPEGAPIVWAGTSTWHGGYENKATNPTGVSSFVRQVFNKTEPGDVHLFTRNKKEVAAAGILTYKIQDPNYQKLFNWESHADHPNQNFDLVLFMKRVYIDESNILKLTGSGAEYISNAYMVSEEKHGSFWVKHGHLFPPK